MFAATKMMFTSGAPGLVPSKVSYVGSATASAATTITIPTHAVGDVMVMFAIRTTSPENWATVPSGWTTVHTSAATGTNNAPALKVAYKVATATNDASGTWTNATILMVGVWRNVAGIGGVDSQMTPTNTNPITYPAITMAQTNGSSWVTRVARASHTAGAQTAIPAYASRLDNATGLIADTNAGVTSAGVITQAVPNVAVLGRCVTLELIST